MGFGAVAVAMVGKEENHVYPQVCLNVKKIASLVPVQVIQAVVQDTVFLHIMVITVNHLQKLLKDVHHKRQNVTETI